MKTAFVVCINDQISFVNSVEFAFSIAFQTVLHAISMETYQECNGHLCYLTPLRQDVPSNILSVLANDKMVLRMFGTNTHLTLKKKKHCQNNIFSNCFALRSMSIVKYLIRDKINYIIPILVLFDNIQSFFCLMNKFKASNKRWITYWDSHFYWYLVLKQK